jgi:hypothetical protein
MIKNNLEIDVKVKCLEAGMTQMQVGEKINSTGQYVNRIIKKRWNCKEKCYGITKTVIVIVK